MEALRLVLLYVHLFGFALLLGGAIAQYVTGKLKINSAMLWGAIIQVVYRHRPRGSAAGRQRAGPGEARHQVPARA